MTMTCSTPVYSPAKCNNLRTAQGGYPDLTALPAGLTSKSRLVPQVDAADRAFLRHGMHSDGAHLGEDGDDHPLLLAFKKENPGVLGEQIRKDFLTLLRRDLYDVVRVLLPVLELLVTDLNTGHCHGPALWRSDTHSTNR